jgi:hypothetical protein
MWPTMLAPASHFAGLRYVSAGLSQMLSPASFPEEPVDGVELPLPLTGRHDRPDKRTAVSTPLVRMKSSILVSTTIDWPIVLLGCSATSWIPVGRVALGSIPGHVGLHGHVPVLGSVLPPIAPYRSRH